MNRETLWRRLGPTLAIVAAVACGDDDSNSGPGGGGGAPGKAGSMGAGGTTGAMGASGAGGSGQPAGGAAGSAGGAGAGSAGAAGAGAGGSPGGSAGVSGSPGGSAGVGGSPGGSAGVGGSSAGGSGEGGSGAGGSSAGAAGAGGSPGARTLLSEGLSTLIDVFATEEGVVIVVANEVKLVDRQGALVVSRPWAREVTAATFDGTRLVVADVERFTTFDTQLAQVGEGALLAPCLTAAPVSGSRFVCGTDDFDAPALVTYDVHTGQPLGQIGSFYGLEGRWMRRVPGTDDIVVASKNLSPQDFYLYRVLASHTPVYLGESPYHGDGMTASFAFAFDGNPPQHVVNDEGTLLKINVPVCHPGLSWEPSPDACFYVDGNLGPLREFERFVAMADDGAGVVAGLADPRGNQWWYGQVCEDGCFLLRSDVSTRDVLSRIEYAFEAGRILASTHDPVSSRFLVGYTQPAPPGQPDEEDFGHRVELLDYIETSPAPHRR